MKFPLSAICVPVDFGGRRATDDAMSDWSGYAAVGAAVVEKTRMRRRVVERSERVGQSRSEGPADWTRTSVEGRAARRETEWIGVELKGGQRETRVRRGGGRRAIIPECTQVVNYRLKVVGAARERFGSSYILESYLKQRVKE